jgi:hypothetical protein
MVVGFFTEISDMVLFDSSILSVSGLVGMGDHSSWNLMTDQVMDSITFLAQNMSEIKKIDIIGDFQKSFKHFIESGQVWALGIGIVLGWIFHSFLGS